MQGTQEAMHSNNEGMQLKRKTQNRKTSTQREGHTAHEKDSKQRQEHGTVRVVLDLMPFLLRPGK